MADPGRPKKRECYVCGFDRALDRAHLFPRRIAENVRGWKRYESYEGKHIVLLCRNHHFLFDLNRLNDEEEAKLAMAYKAIGKEMADILSVHIRPGNASARREDTKKQRAYTKWYDRIVPFLLKHGVIVSNYGRA